ncbi:MAG: sigma-E factor negative regulatory protein [Gammaproteobacteria bacterium]|nr:sigma-E factor negative regulatory protein [Gammaproteobacteria bacterium]
MSNDKIMQEKLSAFVDNELDELETRQLMAALSQDATLRRTWERYHVARSALHQDSEILLVANVAEKVAQQIESEPSRAGSYRRQQALRVVSTLALAASVAAIAILGVQRLNDKPESSAAALVAGGKPAGQVIRSGTTRWDTKEPGAENALNAYLVEHNEFASTSGIGGMMPYVRVVGYDNNNK